MLWLDTDPKKPLVQKVVEAMRYYSNKYGGVPTLCQVNPKDYEPVNPAIMQVEPMRYILPGHLWIGIQDKA